jgi:predicted RNA binding protein YcfA (HicA-like mRNA interferase family)
LKLPRLTGRELCKIVEKLGFQKIRHVGSHARYAHQDGRKTTIPLHSNEELGPGLILEILSQIKITRKELEKIR